MSTVLDVAPALGVLPTCAAFGVPRATYYRKRAPVHGPKPPRQVPGRRLPDCERQQVLDTLHEPRFVDLAPIEVYATLLQEGRYMCSARTMHRILAEHAEVRERRDQLRHPSYQKPELLATAPNQLWSWDITKLLGPQKWTYYYLYVLLDVFSRYVVGWMVAHRESASLADKLIAQTCARQGILPGQLTLHADRGASMTSKAVAFLLADLGVTKTHSRPHVSNDNPFSEANFKTLKYRPDFPDRFGEIEDARAHCSPFFQWYNYDHHHSALSLLTPADVHYGCVDERISQRQVVLDAAFDVHPERFPHGRPIARQPPREVWINKPVQASCTLADSTAAAPGLGRSPSQARGSEPQAASLDVGTAALATSSSPVADTLNRPLIAARTDAAISSTSQAGLIPPATPSPLSGVAH
jgi:putative transposase